MSIKQHVQCPECKHNFVMPDDIANMMMSRNRELEQAFRELMALCMRYVPLHVNEKTAP